jgi:RNase adaptor protein for sRNA GlmZ degradation
MSNSGVEGDNLPLIKVVGVSGSGKSTLVAGLRRAGYNARPVSQEHSNVPELWQQFDYPAVLIFLLGDLPSQRRRRPDVTWTAAALAEEYRRLAHARDHADLKIDTSGLSGESVLSLAVAYLRHLQVAHADGALAPLPATGSALQPSLSLP